VTATRAIARATIEEVAQRRVVVVAVVLALGALGLSAMTFSHIAGLSIRVGAFFGTETQLVASQLLILLMFLWSGLIAVIAAFYGAAVVAGEIGSGEALAVLARPVRRVELLLGRWLGLAVVIVAFAASVTIAQMLIAFVATGLAPANAIGVVVFVGAHALVILTVAVALATRLSVTAAAVGTLMLFGFAWVGGIVGGIGAWTNGPALMQASSITKILLPSDAVWRGALFMLERPGGLFSGARSVTMAANPIFGTENPTPELFLAYAVAWVVALLVVSAISLRTRDL
jgi:ABC-2 type transport system permease protein